MAVTNPFFKSCRILGRYKRLIVLSVVGSLIGACTFGAGLAMILPTFHLLLDKGEPLAKLVQEYMVVPTRPQWVQDLGTWLIPLLPEGQLSGFILIMSIIAVLSIVGSLATFFREIMAITVSYRAALLYRQRIFKRLVHAPLAHSMRQTGGDRITRLVVDTDLVARGYEMLLGRSVGEILGGGAALSVAFMINWRLSLLALVALPGVAVLLRKVGKVIRRTTRKVLGEQGRMISALGESLDSLRVVKVHNAEGYERRRFSVLNKRIYREQMKARMAKAISSPLTKTMAHIVMAGVAVVAAWLTISKGVQAKEFLAVLAALAGAGASIKPLTTLNNQLHASSAAAQRMLDTLRYPIETSGAAAAALPPLRRHRKSIVFDGVSYTYPTGDTPAVRDIDLEVRFGETVAFVGGNGSGKTTLMSLLPRLLDPSGGRILIDDADIVDVRLRSLRRQIGVVTQETVLFQGTIAQNIAYGCRHISRERIEAAARAAYAHEFIETLPDGMDTMLGEHGTGLSGGQKQRLCIARALLRDPSIMILDEATSQIDAKSEVHINQALRDLHDERTTFVIAHRLSTVVNADRIVVMDDARIIDIGSHDELLDRSPMYQVFAQTQLKPQRAAPEVEVSDTVRVSDTV